MGDVGTGGLFEDPEVEADLRRKVKWEEDNMLERVRGVGMTRTQRGGGHMKRVEEIRVVEYDVCDTSPSGYCGV